MPARLTTGRHFYLPVRLLRKRTSAGVAVPRVFIMRPVLTVLADPLAAAILKGGGHMGRNQPGWDGDNGIAD